MSDWDAIRRQWQGQAAAKADAGLQDVVADSERLRRQLRWRDRIETAAAVFVAVAFLASAILFVAIGKPLAAAWSVAIAVWAGWVPFRLRRSRIEEPSAHLSTREYLQRQRDGLLDQARMLERAWLWYVLPPTVGAIGFVLSLVAPIGPAEWEYCLLVVAMGVAIAWLNGWVARTRLRPAAGRIDEQLASLEDEPGG